MREALELSLKASKVPDVSQFTTTYNLLPMSSSSLHHIYFLISLTDSCLHSNKNGVPILNTFSVFSIFMFTFKLVSFTRINLITLQT